jgi:hypothetical protein
VQFIDAGKSLFCSAIKPHELSLDPLPSDWRVWDLSPDLRPVDQLQEIAQVLSGRQNAELGGGLLIERNALSNSWKRLRLHHTNEFRVTPEEVRAWHRRQAKLHQAGGRGDAAQFHLDRLNDLLRENPDIRK